MTLQLRVTLNAGAPQVGSVQATYSDVVHLDAANYVGWGLATWTIYAYPDGFTVPAGWTEATVEQASGLFATVYQYQGTTPPSFTLPAATYWGKWLLSLSVVIGGETVTDEATGIEIVSPSGLHDIAWREGVQFGDWKKWTADVAANWRTLEDVAVSQYRWRAEHWHKSDDALASTATTPRPFATVKYACTVTDINYRAHDALTADNTDNVVFTVYAYTAAGALVGKVAEYISNVATGGLVSEVPKSFGAISNASLGAGYGLVVAITKGGAGKIVPAGVLTVNTTLD